LLSGTYLVRSDPIFSVKPFFGIEKGIIVSNPDGTNSALLQLEEA